MIDYINALKWPLLLVSVLIWQSNSISEIFDLIPDVIKRSEEITIGNASFKIAEQLSSDIPNELKSAISGLSNEEIILLVDAGEATHIIHSSRSKKEVDQVKELESRKLAEYESIEPDEYGNNFSYKLTSLGIEANKLIKEVLLQQLGRQ